MEGWIKSYRVTMDNPVVCKDAEYFAVWAYLLYYAAFAPTSALFGGRRILLQPGQLITGRRRIGEKFRISESKVYRILMAFKNERQIELQTSNASSLITVVNWARYQSAEQSVEQPADKPRAIAARPKDTIIRTKEPKKPRNSGAEDPAYEKFKLWIDEHAPTVGRMREPFTAEEFLRLKRDFEIGVIQQTLMSMHNWKPLLSRNMSANITFRKWAAREGSAVGSQAARDASAKLLPRTEEERHKLLNRLKG